MEKQIMISKANLGNYGRLQQDVLALEKRICNLKRIGAKYEYGAVKGSNPEFPYQPMSFHVSGYNIQADEKKRIRIKNLEIKLAKQKKQAEDKRLALEEYIAEIEDVTDRLIFTYLYIDGLTQERAAEKLNLDRSRISRKVDDYIKRTQSTK